MSFVTFMYVYLRITIDIIMIIYINYCMFICILYVFYYIFVKVLSNNWNIFFYLYCSATVRTWHETGHPKNAAAISNGRGNGLRATYL